MATLITTVMVTDTEATMKISSVRIYENKAEWKWDIIQTYSTVTEYKLNNMNLFKIGWRIGYIGVGILFLLLFIHRNDTDGQFSETEMFMFGVPIVIGALIIIFCRFTGRDKE